MQLDLFHLIHESSKTHEQALDCYKPNQLIQPGGESKIVLYRECLMDNGGVNQISQVGVGIGGLSWAPVNQTLQIEGDSHSRFPS